VLLATTAQLPRLPLASTETDTAMSAAYAEPLWKREYLLGHPPTTGAEARIGLARPTWP
jgi:hypothetical protein